MGFRRPDTVPWWLPHPGGGRMPQARSIIPPRSPPMPHRLSRRSFLHTAAGAALSAGLLAADQKKPPASERLRVGVIGVTGQGGGDMDQVAAAGAEVAALCDVDERRAGPVRERFPRAAFYTDFRRLVDH